MADYPDWTRLFHLVGTDITIPINIEASDVTLPVSIDAVTVAIDVNITAAAVTLPISIDAATVTLDVNLTAATATIDINFSDQSVAVFDAAKWFAHNATQVFVTAFATITINTCGTVIDYTVPAGKTFFIVGVSYSVASGATPPLSCRADLIIAATWVLTLGSHMGAGLPLDTPVRATAGQHVYLLLCQYGAGGSMVMYGSIWGYLEDA
jgi:hypothetical protein